MKYLRTIMLVAVLLLALASGIAKIMLIPEELAFFQKVGLTETAIILVGVFQIISAVLILITRFRKIGATLLGLTFGFSTILIFLSGDIVFGLFSLLPITLIFLIVKPKNR